MDIIVDSPKYGKKTILINDEDYNLIKDYTWRVNFVRGNFYAITTICRTGQKPQTIKMHRLILGLTDPKTFVDHKDSDGLNNRRDNIRIATLAQNTRNTGANSRNTTGFKGVYMYKNGHPSSGLFTATLRCKDKKYHGGYFKTAIDAAKKYDELAKIYHGEFAYLNFPI